MFNCIRFTCWFETSSDKLQNVSQSVSVSSFEAVWPTTVRSKSVTFLDFRLSQGSVATYCRLGGNLCDMYIEIFSRIIWWKNFEFWKSVHNCQSYYQTSRGLLFWERCIPWAWWQGQRVQCRRAGCRHTARCRTRLPLGSAVCTSLRRLRPWRAPTRRTTERPWSRYATFGPSPTPRPTAASTDRRRWWHLPRKYAHSHRQYNNPLYRHPEVSS